MRKGRILLPLKHSNTIELTLPSRLGYEKVAMNTAASVARLMGFSEDRVEDMKSAVAEACINSMEHGNQLNEALKVGVLLSVTDSTLEIEVTDEGSGNTGDVHVPDIDKKMSGDEGPRGMGMFLIQSLVDEAEWKTIPDQGGCTRLVIHLKEAV